MNDPIINTYHASIQDDILAPQRSKVLNEKFIPRIVTPNKKKAPKCEISALRTVFKSIAILVTIFVGTFPIMSQQKVIVESMLNQYLIHARRVSTGRRWEDRLNETDNQILPDFYPPKTIFHYTNISLLAFLNPL